MYSFKPISERIQKMHDRIRDRIIEIDDERAKIVTESYKRTENVPWMIRIPMATYDVCANKTVLVEDDDIFVGIRHQSSAHQTSGLSGTDLLGFLVEN